LPSISLCQTSSIIFASLTHEQRENIEQTQVSGLSLQQKHKKKKNKPLACSTQYNSKTRPQKRGQKATAAFSKKLL
jgi:hypothetical protein